jgi:transaldolase
MALFIDSSDPKEIAELYTWGVLSGVTTNPLIIAREAKDADLGERIRQILDVTTGDVSVELTTESHAQMLEEALEYHAWNPSRICIKVPMSETGLRVLHELSRRGIRTNMTCLMALNQAYLAAIAGATYVSFFAGRIRDMGYEAKPVIEQMRNILDREGLPSKIIVGSIRHMMDVNDALASGAHIPTVTPPILRKMVHHPRTVETIEEFNRAWRERGVP